MMVAAHPNDLSTARSCGLKTAFVPRPLENGPEKKAWSAVEEPCDVRAQDFMELATKLTKGAV
jgi:2-haloacid dehalogenase